MELSTASKGPLVLGHCSDPKAADDIAAAIAGQWSAWNAGEPLHVSDFTPDSDYVTFDGTELHGVEENRRLHDHFGRGILRGSRLTGSVRRIRFVTDDVALVHSRGNLQLRFHPRPKPSRDSIQTTVMRRTAEGWKIEAFQNTRVVRRGVIANLAVWLANRL